MPVRVIQEVKENANEFRGVCEDVYAIYTSPNISIVERDQNLDLLHATLELNQLVHF